LHGLLLHALLHACTRSVSRTVRYSLAVLQIHEQLDFWHMRASQPLFPKQLLKEANQRLKESYGQRYSKLATRVAATHVQTAQGVGPDSYLPLSIPCMYGSYMPKVPFDEHHELSATDLVRLRCVIACTILKH
jgi:hypothetical protein